MSYTSISLAILLTFLYYRLPEIIYPKSPHLLYYCTPDCGRSSCDDDSNIISLFFSSIKPNPFSFYAPEIPPRSHDESK